MIAVVQRVKSCSVEIKDNPATSINKGMLVFIGIEVEDTDDDIKYITHKLLKLRIFNDVSDKMNLSIEDIDAEIMIVSQFTLCGETRKGNRPSYTSAMKVDQARDTYNKFTFYLSGCYNKTKTGTFQADMDIHLVNDGPVTLIVRSKH